MLASIEDVVRESGLNKSQIAKHLGLVPSALYSWKLVPAVHVRRLSELTGGRVSCHHLRPDVFGAEIDKNNKTVSGMA